MEQMQVTELQSLAAAVSAHPREASMVASSALGLADGHTATEDSVAEALLSHTEFEGGFGTVQVPTQATSSVRVLTPCS